MAFQNRQAFGDIYTIPTTAIDNIANRLYREQQIREQQKLQQDKALDDEFAKNVAGVKSADIPEITSAYNDFKQAHINLQKKGQKATPQDQMDVMLKKAAAFQAINASKEEKERVKNAIIEGRGDKKGRFIPTYQEVLTKRLNTPTSKVKDEDFDIRNVYSFPDMAKVTSGWMGKSKKMNVPTGAKSIKGDLYDDEYIFEKFNHPNQIYENAYREIAGRGDREAFENVVLESLSDEEKEKVKNDYFAITSSPEFKRIYGDVQPFPESAGKTRLGEAIALTTMGMVNKLPLKELDIESKPNTGAVIDKRAGMANAEWDRSNEITYQQSLNKIAANKAAGQVPEDLGYLSDNVSDEVGRDVNITFEGKTVPKRVVYVDEVDPERLDIITGRDLSKKKFGVKPIAFKGGKMGYYVDQNTGDWEGADGQKISREAVKDRYIQSKAGTKFKAQSGTKASENTLPKVKGTTKSGLPVFHK